MMLAKLRNINALRRRLKGHQGHFRRLLGSAVRNGAGLALLRMRSRLRGRKVIAIGLIERLGDIVACTPIAGQLRRDFPDASIVWMIRSPYVDILRGNPDIDAIVEVHCTTELLWLSRRSFFDTVLILHLSGHKCDSCDSPIYHKNPSVGFDNYYKIGGLLKSHAMAASYPISDGQPTIVVDRSTSLAVDRLGLPERFVAVHAKSEDPRRDWDTEGWVGLSRHIATIHDLPVVELGMQSVLDGHDLANHVNLCGKCTLKESAEVIRRATLFVGIDSGPAHIANAMRTPGVVLLGQFATFDRYLPYSGFYADPEHCRVVQYDGPASAIPLELACETVDQSLNTARVLNR